MKHHSRYVTSSVLPVAVEDAFSYHQRDGALERLIPPWESVSIQRTGQGIEVGTEVSVQGRLLGIPLKMVAEHTEYAPPNFFRDVQKSGPLKSWQHDHRFESAGDEQSTLTDEFNYCMLLGWLGRAIDSGTFRRKLESMFAYRHRVTRDDLQLLVDYPFEEPLRVAVSGSTGLVGSRFSQLLSLLGHQVTSLIRDDDASADDSTMAPWSDHPDEDFLASHDAVVHLAGRPIADRRWSDRVKSEIRDSRVIKTRQLCELLAKLSRKPKVFVCASATGIYGDQGDEKLDERSSTDTGFLAEVASEWEAACRPAVDAGIRVVHARLGIVLSPASGALSKMITPAKLCGGKLGSGRQWMSWIGLDDCLGAIYHAIMTETVVGAMNVVSPQPIRNQEFAKTLGQVIGRPAIFPAPAFGLRAALGEMADALLLSSTRVDPRVLTETGYEFRFTDLHALLRYLLGYEFRESSE